MPVPWWSTSPPLPHPPPPTLCPAAAKVGKPPAPSLDEKGHKAGHTFIFISLICFSIPTVSELEGKVGSPPSHPHFCK